jgi:uncharacterized 2Fe-2S/4Fe-4S cluster protein (DUF4445 family)
MDKIEIRFLPHEKAVQVESGSNLLDVAREASIDIESHCDGMGTCGKCVVRQIHGPMEEPHSDELRLISKERLAQGVRLACRLKATENATFRVANSEVKHPILAEGFMPEYTLDPKIRKVYLELARPALEDSLDDISRIERALGLKLSGSFPLSVLRQIPGLLKSCDFKVTCILSGENLIGLEPGDTSHLCYGIAVDIGTTTIVVSLHDLATGTELATSSMMNPQKIHGLDVLSRIQHVREQENGLENLRSLVINGINSLIANVSFEIGVERQNIYETTVAANSTMMHLFLGVDPSGIGRSPYIASFTMGTSFRASEIGLFISRYGEVYCLPSVSAYIGADIVAGILCTELADKNERSLFIDIGTNGEIAFSSDEGIFACSCAAGPALEGMNISCGMRAANGAIDSVSINGDVEIRTIGDKPATGLCGSGVIDAVGELIKAGIVAQSGRFTLPLPEERKPWASRLQSDSGKWSFVLAAGENGSAPVALTQKDIRQVQLAKGAILSGILALLDHLGLDFSGVERVYIAGAFGCHIRMDSFACLGVIPQQLLDRVVLVGNSSKSGAVLCLLSQSKREEASKIAPRVQYIELSCYPDYDKLFTRCLSFPEVCKL